MILQEKTWIWVIMTELKLRLSLSDAKVVRCCLTGLQFRRSTGVLNGATFHRLHIESTVLTTKPFEVSDNSIEGPTHLAWTESRNSFSFDVSA